MEKSERGNEMHRKRISAVNHDSDPRPNQNIIFEDEYVYKHSGSVCMVGLRTGAFTQATRFPLPNPTWRT